MITVTKETNLDLFIEACRFTSGFKNINPDIYRDLILAGHSPIQTQMYCVKIEGHQVFIANQNARHHVGVSHFIRTMRDDNYRVDTVPDRNTPTNHMMFLNAQALRNIAFKRLCYKAHKETRLVMEEIRNQVKLVDPVLASMLVPNCILSGGHCPEKDRSCGKVKLQWKRYEGEKYWQGCPSI